MNVGILYYRNFDFSKLKYDTPCCTHLGTMRNYLPGPLRVQFPKLRVKSISNKEMVILVKNNSPGFDFLRRLEECNAKNLVKNPVKNPVKNKEPLIQANSLGNSEFSGICMKLKPNTLFFTENDELISSSHIKNILDPSDPSNPSVVIRAVCIANSQGLWTANKSYGNTWNVEQVKIYEECVEDSANIL